MIPAQIQVLIIAVAVASAGSFWAGMEWNKGQVAQVEVKETKVEVETHNENTITQDKHEAAMLQLERDLRKRLGQSPRHDVSGDCPVAELTVMRNNKIEIFNSTLFPSAN